MVQLTASSDDNNTDTSSVVTVTSSQAEQKQAQKQQQEQQQRSQEDEIKIPIERPAELDILCGRGRALGKHPGNKKFITLIRQNLDLYAHATKRIDKSLLVASIVESLQKDGARFLRKQTIQTDDETDDPPNTKDGKTGSVISDNMKTQGFYYLELSLDQAREKTGHAMRDLIKDQKDKMVRQQQPPTKKKRSRKGTSSVASKSKKQKKEEEEYEPNKQNATVPSDANEVKIEEGTVIISSTPFDGQGVFQLEGDIDDNTNENSSSSFHERPEVQEQDQSQGQAEEPSRKRRRRRWSSAVMDIIDSNEYLCMEDLDVLEKSIFLDPAVFSMDSNGVNRASATTSNHQEFPSGPPVRQQAQQDTCDTNNEQPMDDDLDPLRLSYRLSQGLAMMDTKDLMALQDALKEQFATDADADDDENKDDEDVQPQSHHEDKQIQSMSTMPMPRFSVTGSTPGASTTAAMMMVDPLRMSYRLSQGLAAMDPKDLFQLREILAEEAYEY